MPVGKPNATCWGIKPEPEYGTFSQHLLDDEEVRAAAMRVTQLSKTHECELVCVLVGRLGIESWTLVDVLPPAVRDAQHAWTVWSQGIAVTVRTDHTSVLGN